MFGFGSNSGQDKKDNDQKEYKEADSYGQFSRTPDSSGSTTNFGAPSDQSNLIASFGSSEGPNKAQFSAGFDGSIPRANIPAHLDDTQKIVIRQRGGGSAKPLEKVERQGITMFTEKLSATIGPSYVCSFIVGGLYGLTKVPPARHRRTTRLMINSYLNNVGKTSARFGNNVGGAILMYITMGKFLNFLFQEEFDDFTNAQVQSAVFGAASGALYKCTRGPRAMVLASVMGSVIGYAYQNAWQKGYFRFTM